MALFNNGYPASYQPAYQPNYYGQNNNNLIWVQGEAGAKSYLVAPNSTVTLWDSENQVIYLKSADASGMPSMRIIDYTIRGAETPNNGVFNSTDNFLSKKDLEPITAEIESLKKDIESLKEK